MSGFGAQALSIRQAHVASDVAKVALTSLPIRRSWPSDVSRHLLYSGLYLNFCPAMEASYIKPPFATVNTAMPL